MRPESAAATAHRDRDTRLPPERELRLWRRWLVLGLLGAWSVPVLLHIVRLDLVVWALLLVGTASLLRSGTSLIDRLFLAGIILTGAVLAAGLLFSIWPWGLAPVPVGGTLLSSIVVIACIMRRIPQLPARLQWSDSVIVGSGLATFAVTYHPVSGLGLAERLTYSTTQLDRLAHFALFQTIGRVGGYAFLHQSDARISVQTPTEYVYPQGSHFLLALVDAFSRLSGSPVGNYERYFTYVLIGFAALMASIVWAARWIAGAGLREGSRTFICCATAAFALFGVLPGLLRQGYDSEIFGLVFVALATAIAVRPVRLVREQLILVSALSVSVFYTYNIFGPLVGLAIGLSLVAYRIPRRPDWRFAAILLPVAVLVATLPSMLGVIEGFDAQAQSLVGGSGIRLSAVLVPLLALIVLSPSLYRPVRRDPAWRGIAAQFLAAVLIVGLFGVYQRSQIGSTGYYYEKLMTAAYVSVLACVGAVGFAIRAAGTAPVGPRSSHVQPPGIRSRQAIAAAALALLLTAGLLELSMNPRTKGLDRLSSIPLVKWEQGRVRSAIAAPAISFARAGLLGDRVASIPVYGASARYDWFLAFFMASYNGDLGLMQAPLGQLKMPVVTVGKGASATTAQHLASIVAAVRVSPVPLRLIVRNDQIEQNLRSLLAANHLSATIVIGPQF
jgi:hypothetical protein